MTLGIAAVKGFSPITNVATTGPLESSEWSLDGDTFRTSIGAPFVSQDVKHQNGSFSITGPDGVCFSSTGGAIYACHKVPLHNNGTGRYSSSPSANVIYMTAGQWPQTNPGERIKQRPNGDRHYRVSGMLRIVYSNDGTVKTAEMGQEAFDGDTNGTYTAELWKSADGGKTWKNLINDKGNFYFNDIHCIDETHCVAVGEGFAQDGSGSPGARVYVTEDGETFKLVHTESSLGTESLMAARMLSTTEHWVGGTAQPGSFTAPTFLLHSQDGGKTYPNENSGVRGQMITALDFISAEHGYATSLNALQLSALLEFGGKPGPAPQHPHYEKPPCQSDEKKVSVQGATGAFCSPSCSAGPCPSDKPAGVTASPSCALQDQKTGAKYCALTCLVDVQCDVKNGASCQKLSPAQGICTYPSSASTVVLFQGSLDLPSELIV
eukprot:gnl/MRDRNA2_/MRDRNA2_84248_c0_seq2.p1 gnl/MRDRNA2_/MRDRNA2_84248_c0~~gnl/MRDRNA2_/MRDRNA2_84248_c0_seq2.p1  ORF type:complete len:436 (+),score=76.44 gnl/MRDRNA2_/MRDRNA2_84248_c0_seq2:272-1579(+)